MVRIKPGSGKITPTQRPGVVPDVATLTTATFANTPIRADGEVTLLGDAGDSAANWRLGFIQVEWVETNWVYYRGLTNGDGSVFIQRARPPARNQRATRDTLDRPGGGATTVNLIFYDGLNQAGGVKDGLATDTFPLTLKCSHFDQPNLPVPAQLTNELTGAVNFLREAQFEFMFVTVLSVRDPANNFTHLASFYWNVRHQATFTPQVAAGVATGLTPHVVKADTGPGISHVIPGRPTDHRFINVLTSVQPGSSNDIFRAAMNAATTVGAKNRHPSRVWESFDVRKA